MPHLLRRYWLPITSFFFLVLFIGTLLVFWQQSRRYPELIMADDIEQLAAIFLKINETAGIQGFEHQKNQVNFLNVTSFVGSEVGSMNLLHPGKWNGPYLHDNPTMQEQYYQIINTKNGYFLTPGDGVQLKNGKVIGKDIMLGYDADLISLAADEEALRFGNRPLAAPIKTQKDRELRPNFYNPFKE